jgi:hypothetical protein
VQRVARSRHSFVSHSSAAFPPFANSFQAQRFGTRLEGYWPHWGYWGPFVASSVISAHQGVHAIVERHYLRGIRSMYKSIPNLFGPIHSSMADNVLPHCSDDSFV